MRPFRRLRADYLANTVQIGRRDEYHIRERLSGDRAAHRNPTPRAPSLRSVVHPAYWEFYLRRLAEPTCAAVRSF